MRFYEKRCKIYWILQSDFIWYQCKQKKILSVGGLEPTTFGSHYVSTKPLNYLAHWDAKLPKSTMKTSKFRLTLLHSVFILNFCISLTIIFVKVKTLVVSDSFYVALACWNSANRFACLSIQEQLSFSKWNYSSTVADGRPC